MIENAEPVQASEITEDERKSTLRFLEKLRKKVERKRYINPDCMGYDRVIWGSNGQPLMRIHETMSGDLYVYEVRKGKFTATRRKVTPELIQKMYEELERKASTPPPKTSSDDLDKPTTSNVGATKTQE